MGEWETGRIGEYSRSRNKNDVVWSRGSLLIAQIANSMNLAPSVPPLSHSPALPSLQLSQSPILPFSHSPILQLSHALQSLRSEATGLPKVSNAGFKTAAGPRT